VGVVLVSKKEWRTESKAEKAAQGLVDCWNQYLSGDVWCTVVETYGPDKAQIDYDTVGGFYGSKCAAEELRQQVENKAAELQKAAK
jgi:hypothetical protein